MSADLDSETPSLPPDVVEHHLHACAGCRRWSEDVTALHRCLRVQPAAPEPDRTAAILAALPSRRAITNDPVRGLRISALVIALVQLFAAVPLLFPRGPMAAMDGHLERHIGIFAVAMSVGLLVVAWRPERARAMLPVLGVLVVGLVWTCFGDVWAGRAIPGSLVAHAADLAGFAAVCMLARADGEHERVRRQRALLG